MKIREVRQTIEKYVTAGSVVIAAVSGGADSVCLLSVLDRLKNEMGFKLSACHVNHNLRGEESLRDEFFVRRLCRQLDIPLYVKSIDVAANAEKHESIELAARRIRYDFFDELSRLYGGALIATAHTASDNCETVLINLIRGTALSGMCGIPPKRDNIIRPLLCLTRRDIEEYCSENGLSFVTDSTNLSDDYTRNKIRHNIIPQIERINPSFSFAVSRLTRSLSEDDSYLDLKARELLKSAEKNGGYDVRVLCKAEDCILNRAAAMILKQGDIPLNRLAIDGCVQIIREKQGKINPCKYKFVQIRKKIITVITDYSKFRKTDK